jgi:hypothetical protein
MYRFVVASILCLAPFMSHAQGYVGAVAALSSIGIDCADKLSCDKRGRGIKLYGGTKLSPNNRIDIGSIGSISAIEVAAINFGKVSTTENSAPYTVVDTTINFSVSDTPVTRAVTKTGTSNALAIAAVADFPIVTDLVLSLKLGAAYVSSTLRTYVDGVENGSVTETKLKPYIGLGLSYAIVDSVKIVGSYDRTGFDVDGRKSHSSNIGLGAEIGF